MKISSGKHRGRMIAITAMLSLLPLYGCTQRDSPATTASIGSLAQAVAQATQAPSDLPKVPFAHQPCQSLSQDEQKRIEMQAQGYATPVQGKPDRAPGNLPFDNVCIYHDFSVGYMSQGDYQVNHDGNRSTEHADPPDLPDAFYGKQDGLWFEKNGYYVNIEGRHRLQLPVAKAIAAKL